MTKKTVPDMLIEAANTYADRNKGYGDAYKKHGEVMRALFPKGMLTAIRMPEGSTQPTDMDYNRIGVMNMIVGKLTRYAQNFGSGGHADSLHDLSVYVTMLAELDAEEAEARRFDFEQMEKYLKG